MHNQRKEQRIGSQIHIFIELTARSADALQEGEVLRCDTMNLSPEGLGIIADKALFTGSILQIGAELVSEAPPLFMAAEVAWCAAIHKEKAFLAGLHLLPASDSDQLQWYEHINHQIQKSKLP